MFELSIIKGSARSQHISQNKPINTGDVSLLSINNCNNGHRLPSSILTSYQQSPWHKYKAVIRLLMISQHVIIIVPEMLPYSKYVN